MVIKIIKNVLIECFMACPYCFFYGIIIIPLLYFTFNIRMLNLKFSPETVIMLTFAVIIDLIGIILICFALDDFGVLDIVSGVIIGGWMLFRRGRVVNIKTQKKQIVRFLAGMGIEITPYLGALPAVTVITLLTLREK